MVAVDARDGSIVWDVKVDGQPFGGATVVNDLVFGSTLTGDLDQLELYDFTRQPLAVFANGRKTIELTLDSQGEATTTIRTTGVFFSPAEGSQAPPVVPVVRGTDSDGVRGGDPAAACGFGRRLKASGTPSGAMSGACLCPFPPASCAP